MILEYIISTSTSLVASFIYDAHKGNFRNFNEILEKAFSETSIYFATRSENSFELSTEQFKKVLVGDALIEEIENFNLGDKEIDENKLALNFAIFSGFYLEDESQLLVIAKEIISYFIKKLDSLLLTHPQYFAVQLKSYIQIASNKNIEYSKIIQSKLDDIKDTIRSIPDQKYHDEQYCEIKKIITTDKVHHIGYYKNEFDELKQFIKENKYTTAKRKANDLKSRIEKSSSIERDDLFLINSYLAEIALQSIFNQKDAIQYFNESIKWCDDEEKKHRHISWQHLLNGDYVNALASIDKALSSDSTKIENVQVKLNILISLKEYEAAKKMSSILSDDVQGLYLKSWIYFRTGSFNESLNYIEKILQIDSGNIEAIILYCDCIVAEKSNYFLSNTLIDNVIFELLTKAKKLLEVALTIIDPEHIEKKSYILYLKGIFCFFLNDNLQSIKALEESIRLNKQNEYAFRNLGFAYLSVGDYSSAINIFTEIKMINPNHQDIEILLLDTYLLLGDTDIVIKEIENIKLQDSNYDIRYDLILIETYDIRLETTKAEKMLDEIESKYGLIPEVIMAKCKHGINTDDKEKVIKFLESNLDLLKGNNYFKYAYNVLADCYYLLGNYRKAADIYESLASPFKIDQNIKRLLLCLYQLNDYQECLKLCEIVKKHHGYQYAFVECEALINLHTSNFEDASELFIQLISHESTKNKFKIHYGYCQYRLGKEDSAVDAFKQCESNKDISSEELILLSKTYSSTGNIEKSLHLAFEAVIKDAFEFKTNMNFISTFLMNSNQGRFVEEKYAVQFQKSLRTLEEHFPDSKSFQVLKYNTEDDSFIDYIKNMLIQSTNFCQNAETVYLEKKLPIAFLSKALNRNIIEVWEKVVTFPHLTVFYSDGTPASRMDENKNATISKDILIDIVALLTLNQLSILDKIHTVFNNIYISQSTIDIILGMKTQYEMSSKTKGSTLWYENGRFFNMDLNPSYYDAKICDLQNILDFINNNSFFKIIGKTMKVDFKFTDKQQGSLNSIKNLSENVYDNIEVCINRNLSYYADDWMLRFMCNEFSVPSFGCQAVLVLLLNNKSITNDEYNSYLIKLYSMNYHFISITAETLIYSVKSNNFLRNPISLIPFNSLRHRDNDIYILIEIVISFLKWIWLNAAVPEIKFQWTNIILESLTFNREKQIIINTLFLRSNEFISYLAPHHLYDFNQFIKDWKKIHYLV